MSKLDRYLSPNPAKAAIERYWLYYTPVWGVVTGVVMMGGFADRWTDVPLMLFSLLLAVGAVVVPVFRRHASERDKPWHNTVAFRVGLSVVLFSIFGNYTWCVFFYDVLHMNYGFNTTWNIRNNPLQMYVITIAYFATYAVLINVGYRAAKLHLAQAPKPLRWLGMGLVPFVVAALETALNANPFIDSLFCYDDLAFVLGFGSLAYGVAFVVCLPVWIGVDEDAAKPTRQRDVWLWCLAAMYVTVLAYDFMTYEVAPHFTTVEEGAWKTNFRDFEHSCLKPPKE